MMKTPSRFALYPALAPHAALALFMAAGQVALADAQALPTEHGTVPLRTQMVVAESKAEAGRPITSLAFSPDGQILAAGHSFDVRLWEAATGKALPAPMIGAEERRHEERFEVVGFSPNGKYLVAGSSRSIHIWALPQVTKLQTHGFPDRQRPASVSADAEVLCTRDGRDIKLWETATGKLLRTFSHPAYHGGATLSPDGAFIAAGESRIPVIYPAGYKPHIMVWDTRTGEEVVRLEQFGALAFSPDSQQFVTSDMHLYDLKTGELLRRFAPPDSSPSPFALSLTFSPDGKRLAASLLDSQSQNMVGFWDAQTGGLVQRLTGVEGSVWALAFSPDSKRFATGNVMGLVRIWPVAERPGN